MITMLFCPLKGNRDERENVDTSIAQQDAQVMYTLHHSSIIVYVSMKASVFFTS